MQDRVAQLFLKYLPPLAGLRRIPFLGGWLHRTSRQIVPADIRVWAQTHQGAGKGLWLKLNPRTGRDHYEGTVELPVQQVLSEHLRPGMVFYDIGANIGFFTLIAARLVGDQGKVCAFEAEPDAFQRLKENIERNNFRNVVAVESAVWSTTGSVTFLRSDPSRSPDRGLGRVAASAKDGDRIVVPSVALDDFVRTAPPPHFIKCDAEGAEVEIFRAAKRVLGHYKPTVVCETHSPQTAQALEELFRGFAYVLKVLDGDHLLALPT